MRICEKCGSTFDADYAFCPECGGKTIDLISMPDENNPGQQAGACDPNAAQGGIYDQSMGRRPVHTAHMTPVNRREHTTDRMLHRAASTKMPVYMLTWDMAVQEPLLCRPKSNLISRNS